jgi:hypothetical protein
VVLLLCASPCALGAEKGHEDAKPKAPDAAVLQDALQQLVRNLREIRQDYYARKQAHEERIDQTAGQIGSLERERAALEREKAELGNRVQELTSEAARLRSQREVHDALRSDVADTLRKFVLQQRAAIKKGQPHRVDERLQLLHRLERDLNSDQPNVSTPVELAWLFAEGELRDAASGAAYTAEVALPDGRRKPARFCHLGHVLVGFVTEDGQDCGYAVPTPDGFTWLLESGDSGASVVRNAVRMLDRREPPRLLLLPLTIQPGEERTGD